MIGKEKSGSVVVGVLGLGIGVLFLAGAGTAQVVAEQERSINEVKERAWDFPKIETRLESIAPGVWRATGVSNAYLVKRPGGYVLIDSGLPHQARKQMDLLASVMQDGPLLYVILTHSHVDHAGGVGLWLSKYPEAKVIAHESFVPMQKTLGQLQPYFGRRGRMAMPELVAQSEQAENQDPLLKPYAISPDILIDDDESLTLSFGDSTLEVIPMPGGEGADGLGVWLADQEILFTGDLTGPHFPMFPNLYSIRGERYREFLPYIRSMDQVLALEPEVLAHGHFDVIRGSDYIADAILRQRDAVQYVHDQTVAGMNAGKGLPELMREIQLPPQLELSEGYGRVSWSVRALWETYTGWFDFQSTTALYPVPAREIYPDLVKAAGGVTPILAEAKKHLAADEPVKALHLVEVAESAEPLNPNVLSLKERALERLKQRALAGDRNFYEVSWLNARLNEVQQALGPEAGAQRVPPHGASAKGEEP